MFLTAVLKTHVDRVFATPTLRTGYRWLQEDLAERGVTIHLTRASLRELVSDAKLAAVRNDTTAGIGISHTSSFRAEIARRADFLRKWTLTDEAFRPDEDRALVRIAQKYALPRRWKLSDPVASDARRATPTYFNWASAN